MKTIIYCRKSSEDSSRQVLSIPSQESNLREIAVKNNLTIDIVLKESMSAKQPGRPEFNKLIKLIEKNPGSTLIVWKLDRLARNPMDEGQIKWFLQNGIIKQILTPDRVYNPEDNALIASVEFGMANQYIKDLSTNVKRGIKAKLEKGEFPGRPPFGYLNDKANHTIIIDEKNKHWIPAIYETYLTGSYSLRMLPKIFAKKGLLTPAGNPYTKSHFHNVLNNHFYYGIIEHKGIFYKGSHTPLISKELFDKVQQLMISPSHIRPQKHFFPARGFIKCAECGCAYTATIKKGHVYYYCTNGKGKCSQHIKYLRSEKLDKLIVKTFKKIRFHKKSIELAFQGSKEIMEYNFGTLEERIKQATLKLHTAQTKLMNLIEVISTDPTMKEAIKPKIKLLEEDIQNIKFDIEQLEQQKNQDPSITLEPTKKAFLQAYSAYFDYLKGTEIKKYELLNKLLWNLEVADHKVQCFQFKSAFQPMALAPKNLSFEGWLGDVDSNHD